MILEQIKGPEELKQLSSRELAILAEEIRTFLIEKISRTGGHLASNLGVVELTIALFKTFDLPQDKIIWDVGHQSYTHKILSGRMAEFDELRQYGGISGFPKRKESPYDSFDTGHSSTSISAGLGIAQGRDLLGEDYRVDRPAPASGLRPFPSQPSVRRPAPAVRSPLHSAHSKNR